MEKKNELDNTLVNLKDFICYKYKKIMTLL